LVEVATAAILVAIWLSAASWSGFVVSSIIALIMIMIALIDLDQFIIPHELSLPLILISFLLLFFDPIHLLPTYPTVLELLAGPILAGFFWLLWAITKGRGMGFADGTLSLSIGWLLGLSAGATAVLLAFWIGAAVSLIILAGQKLMPNQSSGKQLGMKSAVPFGPYLITGYIIVSIPKLDLLDNFNLFLL
jgi:leader peptidase (prepilin peptidase)/N-methyltransferase